LNSGTLDFTGDKNIADPQNYNLKLMYIDTSTESPRAWDISFLLVVGGIISIIVSIILAHWALEGNHNDRIRTHLDNEVFTIPAPDNPTVELKVEILSVEKPAETASRIRNRRLKNQ